MSMKVSLRDGPDGVPVVDLDAELFEDIPSDLYVSTMRIRKKSSKCISASATNKDRNA